MYLSPEYLMFAMMLTQRPLNMKARRGLHMTFIMTPEELKSLSREMHKLQSRHEEFQERADDLVRSLPKSLYLIFRYVSFKEVQQVEVSFTQFAIIHGALLYPQAFLFLSFINIVVCVTLFLVQAIAKGIFSDFS